jgi:hypothetical protein
MIGLGWVLMYNSLVEKNYTSNKDDNKDGNNIKKINNIILNKDIKTTG